MYDANKSIYSGTEKVTGKGGEECRKNKIRTSLSTPMKNEKVSYKSTKNRDIIGEALQCPPSKLLSASR